MAFLDILSADSYGRFNRKLAGLTDIVTAVYWSEILDISVKVLQKKKFDENGFFKLDRKYIESRCNISLEDQLSCDKILENYGILFRSTDDPNMIGVSLETYEKIMVSDDTKKLELQKDKTKLTTSQKAANKKAAVIVTMQRILAGLESDPDLVTKYNTWIMSVYDSGKGFLNRAKIEIFVSAINSYTTDKQVKLGILQEAILSGYTEPDWVISRYNSNKKSKPTTASSLPEQKKTSGTSSNFEF